MKARQYNPTFRYLLIMSLSAMLILSQAFKLHIHVISQSSGAAEQIGQVHIAATLHDDLNQNDFRFQNQNHEHSTEIDIGTDSFVKKMELLVLGMLLLLVGALLFRNFSVSRLCKRTSGLNTKISSLLYLVIPPLRAPPSALYTRFTA